MDRRLLEAVQTGNVQAFHQVLAENPMMLHTLTLFSTENPLHVASALGQLTIVKEILRLKPSFSNELNQDGFSPLHLAAANAYLEIVREFIKSDPQLCGLQGRRKLTPLHSAAMRGKANVTSEMLSAFPGCADDVNAEGETALHLAIRNNQFEVIRVLVKWLTDMKKVDILNMKDEKGNTVLHLATWRKQRQVI